ncbi:unnamed protein product [Malus baccata var. baccata]
MCFASFSSFELEVEVTEQEGILKTCLSADRCLVTQSPWLHMYLNTPISMYFVPIVFLMHQMSNVQTWMSAMLTDEETCTDVFDDVEDGPPKTDVSNRVENVKKVTSNALTLVNSVAENGAF